MGQREHARLETQCGASLMLKGIKVSGRLYGLIFEASVEQRFYNSTGKNVEVVYTFPLPWGAVLLGVDVHIGGKCLKGTVVEKSLSEARYEVALSEGNAAIMLEKNHDHSYSISLGNLAAHEVCIVMLRYAQTLKFEQQSLRLLIPTVIAPRYGNAVIDGGLQPHQVPDHSLLTEYPFDIELQLHGELTLARIASPSHAINIMQCDTGSESMVAVTLAKRSTLDRDFVLVLDQLVHDSVAVWAHDSVELDDIVAMASFCPHIQQKSPIPIAIKILVDCSGSMSGDSIEAAKRSIAAIVEQLDKADRFSLSRFGDSVQHRSRSMWPVTESTQRAARLWIRDLNADLGGTRMADALRSTFSLAQSLSSDVLIVTDGEISAIDEMIEAATASAHRVFVVGIGSSPAESHLQRLAEATRGACDFVAPGEAVGPAVQRMFARLRSPSLTDLTVAWPANSPPQWVSPITTTVFDGDTINVFAKLHHVPDSEVRLLGVRTPGGELEEIGCASISAIVTSGDALPRITVSQQLQSTNIKESAISASEILQLAIAYQLVTDQTNFLLIHQRAEEDRPTDMPDLHAVHQMLPAGWGGVGSTELYDSPAIWRNKRPQHATSSASMTIPDFLKTPKKILNRSNPLYWSQSENNMGLTPLGLCKWLRLTPNKEWPSTFDELRLIGLETEVVDWLELILTPHCASSLPEKTVIETFLYVMSQRGTYESLSRRIGTVTNIQNIALRLKCWVSSKSDIANALIDEHLAEVIMRMLKDMMADTWPALIYTMEIKSVEMMDE